MDNFITLINKNTKVTRLLRKQIYNLYVEIIVEYLVKYRIPISINSILNCHEKFLSLLDKKYPGYLESGLLYLIFSENVDNDFKKLNKRGVRLW